MQWRIVLATIVALCAAAPAWAVDFPYEAYVNSADVYVRSGPGRNYYPTDKLPKGAKVEVYRHDPGGWYAIRPPRQSFSWVASRHLDLNADGLATVNSPRVVARVGSAFSDARDVIQVRLDEGEKVEVLDSHGPAKDSPWCKIAPPRANSVGCSPNSSSVSCPTTWPPTSAKRPVSSPCRATWLHACATCI